MNAPVNFEGRKILLLAGPHSFHAGYIRRSLDLFGIDVLAPAGPASEAFAALSPAEWASVGACIGVDLGKALFADLADRRRDVPFLFVGNEAGTWFPGPYGWLCPPFAAFQVIEAVGQMMATASAAVQVMLQQAATGLDG